MRLFFRCFILIVLVLISCTNNDVASGGDDVANGYIQANCIDSLFNNISGAEANLVGVFLTEEGDSSFYTAKVISDAAGICRFEEVPNGHYVLTIVDSSSNRGAIQSRITIEDDSLINSEALILRKRSTIKGRLFNWSENGGSSIVVPGIFGSYTPDTEGFYTIPYMFIGNYDLCIITDSVTNYLTLSVKNSDNDTIYIRDVEFTENLSEASSIYDFYEHNMERSYQITPIYYEPQDEPVWYENHDFTMVDYLEIVEGSDTLLAQWNLPVIVGISDTTVKHYGNDSTALVTLIKKQMSDASEVFSHAKINGRINFSVDSVYIYTGISNSQLIEPPTGFTVRILYDVYKDSLESYSLWGPETRVGKYSFSPSDTGGMFGEKGLGYLMWILGRSRECFYIGLCEVKNYKDSITGKGFYLPEYVMNISSLSNWSNTSNLALNYSANNLKPETHFIFKYLPDTISLAIEDINQTRLENVIIQIFGSSQDAGFSISDSILYSGVSNSNGIFTFPEEPFLNDNKDDADYPTLLIRTINTLDTTYTWFPLFEVIDSCFVNKFSSYTKRIILE